MFSRFPVTRKRKNVYIYFPGTSRDTIAGDEDLPKVPPVTKEIQDDTRVNALLTDNQRLKGIFSNQVTVIDKLRTTIAQKNEEIETLKKIPKPTPDTQKADSQIAVLRTQLDSTTNERTNVVNALQDSKKTVETLRNQFNNLLSSISNGLEIAPEQLKDDTIEGVLRKLRTDLTTAVQQQKNLFEQSQILSANVSHLTDDLKKARDEKDAVVQKEKERYVALDNLLQSAQKDLTALREQYSKCVSDKDSSTTTIERLRRDVTDAQSKYNVYEKKCKDQLQKLIDDARDRARKLEEENRTLLDKLDKAGKETTETVEKVVKSDKELLDECDKKRKEITSYLPYMERQVQIYGITAATASSNPNWTNFKTSNGPVYDTARASIQRFKDDLNCSEIIELHKAVLDSYEKMRHIDMALVNIYEDAAGAVRVYVRLRPVAFGGSPKTVSKQGKTVVYNGNLCANPVKTYGRFFGVIPETFKNADVFSGCKGTSIDATLQVSGHEEKDEQGQVCCLANDAAGLCRVVNQMKEGYHIILFGYGLSGSGKTHSLLGGLDAEGNMEPGLVQLSIANSGADHVVLRSIFELSYNQIDFRSKGFNSGKFIQLFHRGESVLKNVPPAMIRNEEGPFGAAMDSSGLQFPNLKKEPVSAGDVYNLRQVLDTYRVTNGRIKATPNNPQSSRSHLFITLEFQYAHGVKGYLTVIDMGGRESSLEVLDMFLEKPIDKGWQLTSLLMNNPQLYPGYLTPHIFKPQDASLSWLYDDGRYKTDLNYAQSVNLYVSKLNGISGNIENVIEVIKESVFINETINQLTLFFKMKGDPSRDAQSFGMRELKFPLEDKKSPYDPLKFLSGVPSIANDKMGMFKILSQLSTLFSKPSKFVMICNVRQEAIPVKFCSSTRETLEFAHSIKST